jgi:hypothetical protein
VTARIANLALGLLVGASLVAGCEKKKSVSPVDLGSEIISDSTGKKVKVEMGYIERPGTEVELTFTLTAVGTEEMDKIVLEVALDEMHLVEGGAQWTGFVPPRQPQHHHVVVTPLEWAEQPQARISVVRSRDSELYMARTIRFTNEGEVIEE